VSTASGPGSSVGIATDYGLDGPGIETLSCASVVHQSFSVAQSSVLSAQCTKFIVSACIQSVRTNNKLT
jgi:hypothetical protein